MTTITRIDRFSNDPEREALRRKIEAVNADARDRWGRPDFHEEFAATMTENIFWGFRHENVLEMMTQVENVGEFDRITIKEVRGLRVFWVSLGGYIEQSTIRARVTEMQKDYVGFHLSEEEDKMRANFVESSTEIQGLAIQTMDAAMQVRLISMFQTAIPNTSPYYVSGAGLSLAALDTALTEIQEETELTLPAIIGRASMVDQIFNDLLASNNFTPETNEQLLRTGVIGMYKGARVIRLRNFKNDNDVSYFPNNELYVVGRDASKFGFWGGLVVKEWNEQGGFYWHLLGRRSAGGMLYRPERVRRIVDTSL
jgi:hypothetical protein